MNDANTGHKKSNFFRYRKAGHLESFMQFEENAAKLNDVILANCPQANFIFGVGTSGQLFLPKIAALNPKLIWGTIRKESEKRHSANNVEFFWRPEIADTETLHCVFVDDLVSTGETLAYALKCLEAETKMISSAYGDEALKLNLVFHGAALYNNDVRWKNPREIADYCGRYCNFSDAK